MINKCKERVAGHWDLQEATLKLPSVCSLSLPPIKASKARSFLEGIQAQRSRVDSDRGRAGSVVEGLELLYGHDPVFPHRPEASGLIQSVSADVGMDRLGETESGGFCLTHVVSAVKFPCARIL